MRNSAYHPAESTDVATVHVPSQLRLKPPSDPALARVWPGSWMPPPSPSLTTCASYSIPAGVGGEKKTLFRSGEGAGGGPGETPFVVLPSRTFLPAARPAAAGGSGDAPTCKGWPSGGMRAFV